MILCRRERKSNFLYNIFLYLGLYEGRLSYKRRLQPSELNIEFFFFLFLCVFFALLDPDSADADPDPQHCYKVYCVLMDMP